MSDITINKIYLEDGREAERHVQEDENEKVVEIYVEPPQQKPEKLLNKRIIEKKCPIVYERIIETLDNGEVVDRKIETIDPKIDYKPLETHVPIVKEMEKTQPFNNEFLTKEYVQQTINEAVEKCATKEDMQQAVLTTVKTLRKHEENPVVEKLSMQKIVEERVGQSKTVSMVNIGLAVLIVSQMGALAYILFFM